MAASPKKQDTDFDPQDFLASHGQHEKDIFDLTGRVTKLEGYLSSPQALATFLEEFAKDSRNLEGVFAKMFCRFMKENPDVQASVEKKLTEVDRHFFFKNVKRFGFTVYSVFLVIAGAFTVKFGEYLFTLVFRGSNLFASRASGCVRHAGEWVCRLESGA